MPNVFRAVPAWAGSQVRLIYILLITVVMAYTGLVALYEASTRFMMPLVLDDASSVAALAIKEVRSNPTLENMGQISKELENLSRITSVERFADSKLMEQGLYYTTMPKPNQVVLSVHIFLGVFCLVLGGFQFWPQFRKRFIKAHRAFGALYIVTAPLSVVAALIYLALTPPHHIYDHLVAWLSLWVFGTLAIVSIVMAVLALRAKRIFEHQAWMALSFGCLIVAPMLRWNWLLLGLAFPHIDQETLNLVTMGIMLPEVLLIGYGLTLVNRQYKKAMIKRVISPVATRVRDLFLATTPLWNALAVLSIIIGARAYIYADGMFSLASPSFIPEALIAKEQSVFSTATWLGPLFVLANGVALLLGLQLLYRSLKGDERTSKNTTLVFSLATFITAFCALKIGVSIGLEPNNLLLSGGTLYTAAGALLVAFLTVFFISSFIGQRAIAKESLVFLLSILPFPAMFFIAIQGLQLATLPADYLAVGQGYVVPAGSSLGLFFVAMLYVVYGQATREHG